MWTDKVCIVTGASSGIGLATAVEMVKQGAKIAMAARGLSNMQTAISNLGLSPENILLIEADVTKETDCKKIIDATVNKWGRIDVLVNNAGISMRAMFMDLDLSVLRQLMDVNFWGSVQCTKYALPHLLKSKGSIVGVSSIAGFVGLPARTGYSASKYAMQGFLDALRIELLKTGVHVMIICPGYTNSNIRKTALNSVGTAQGDSPLDEQKLMSAEEVAIHLMKGIEKRKRTVVLTAQGKNTIFVSKFFPAWLDKKIYQVVSSEKDSPFK